MVAVEVGAGSYTRDRSWGWSLWDVPTRERATGDPRSLRLVGGQRLCSLLQQGAWGGGRPEDGAGLDSGGLAGVY